MKKIILLSLLIISFSCKKNVEKETEPVKITQSDYYSSADIAPFLKFDSELSQYGISGIQKSEKFTKDELNMALKENEFDSTKSAEFDYFTATEFDIEKVHYKVIIYKTYGENDADVLNVQLNSYLNNKQIDALLLDCRFTFETEYYSDFVINKNKIVAIKKMAIDNLIFNEDGDIIGNKEKGDTIVTPVNYKMEASGNFVKI